MDLGPDGKNLDVGEAVDILQESDNPLSNQHSSKGKRSFMAFPIAEPSPTEL